MTDAELLKRYVRDSSEEAFAELVDRHAAMVRGVALRTLGGDAARADEATQAVFVILAQKARTIRTGGALGGWLFRTARRTVYTMQRSERRRRARERAAAGRLEEERSMRAAAELAFREEWESVRPYLDGALASLRPAQREAVLLSCMEGRPHAEAAALLGCSTNAVRKRVQAGLRDLRRHLAHKGVRIGAAALLAGVAAEAALAAPPALLAACHAAAGGLAGGAVVGGATAGVAKATMKAIVWWKAQTAAVVTTAVVAAGAVTAPVALELVKPPAERAVAEPARSPAPLRERIPVGGGAMAWGGESKAVDLPAIQAQDLADLLESYESQIRKLQTKASLVYGTAPQDNVMRGPFTPKDSPYSLTQESALDFGASAEYLKERQLTQGLYDNREEAFDGKIGTRLLGGDDIREHMFGEIGESRPERLAYDEVHHPRPAEAAYWPIPGRSLSELVRSASKVEIKTDTVGGMSCYRVTILAHKVETFTYEGKTLTGKSNVLCRAWLSPAVGMLPVRFDNLEQKSADDMEGIPRVIRYQSDFREVAPGIWFPFASRRCRMWVGKEPTVTAMTVEEVKLNDDADVKTRVNFPATTYVTDMIRGIKYRVRPESQ